MILIDERLSNKLANFSFVCTLIVVFIHCQSGGTDAASRFLRSYFPGAFLAMAVPAFFAISGFLLAGKFGRSGWYKEALCKRIKTLLLPYVILNFAYWPLKFAVHVVAMRRFGSEAQTMVLSWRTPFDILGVPFFDGPADGPLWYIATLMYFVLLAPLFCKMICKSKLSAGLLVGLSILAFGVSRCGVFEVPNKLGRVLYFGFSLWGLIFFTVGMFVRIWCKELPMGRGAMFCGVIGAISALLLNRFGLSEDNVYYIVPTLLCMIGMFAIIPSKHWPSCLVGCAFPLYVLHVPFIYCFSAMLKLVHCYGYTFLCWGLVAEYIISVVTLIVFINTLRRFCPKIVEVCFGGR